MVDETYMMGSPFEATPAGKATEELGWSIDKIPVDT